MIGNYYLQFQIFLDLLTVCDWFLISPAFFRLEFAFRTEQIRNYLLLHNCFSLFSVWSLQRSMRPLTFHR